VFGDDCVRGTQEQMMLQVDLVRLSSEAGKTHGNIFLSVFLLCFGTVVIIYIIRLCFYYGFYIEL